MTLYVFMDMRVVVCMREYYATMERVAAAVAAAATAAEEEEEEEERQCRSAWCNGLLPRVH